MNSHISILYLGVAVIVSYFFGELSRRLKLPSIIGYMVVGVIFGSSLLNIFTEDILFNLSFITEIALGFVAFAIGTELDIGSLKQHGIGIVMIIMCESFLAFVLVAIGIYLLTGDMSYALIFGAMAPASAPAGTVAVIQEYRAKGSLTKALYAVVGFDDGLAIIIYGIAFAFAKNLLFQEASGAHLSIIKTSIEPIKEIGLSITIGAIYGFILSYTLRWLRKKHGILIIIFGSMLLLTGTSLLMHISLILTNMVAGFVVVNTRHHSIIDNVSEQMNTMMPILFVLFFFLAGAHLQLSQLPHLGAIGIVYIVCRSIGLLSGARIGGIIGRVEKKIKNYLGLGILSQAGVAIGLALIVKNELTTIDTAHSLLIGSSVIVTITATSIFFEILGPILTKVALKKAGEIPADMQH